MYDEYELEREVTARAHRAGWISRKVQWVGRRSAPDRVYFGFSRCVFIEFKRRGEKPVGHQKIEIERLSGCYPDVHVCDNKEDALRILGIGTTNGED